jgi:hypothetical protein
MPPVPDRPYLVDLWLCGHHYRASMAALDAAGAMVEFLGDLENTFVREPAAAAALLAGRAGPGVRSTRTSCRPGS